MLTKILSYVQSYANCDDPVLDNRIDRVKKLGDWTHQMSQAGWRKYLTGDYSPKERHHIRTGSAMSANSVMRSSFGCPEFRRIVVIPWMSRWWNLGLQRPRTEVKARRAKVKTNIEEMNRALIEEMVHELEETK